jgi:hypothetical protein
MIVFGDSIDLRRSPHYVDNMNCPLRRMGILAPGGGGLPVFFYWNPDPNIFVNYEPIQNFRTLFDFQIQSFEARKKILLDLSSLYMYN